MKMNELTLRDELANYIIKNTRFFLNGMRYYAKEHCYLPAPYFKYEKRIHDFNVFDDDVWIATYPKCGTTWTQEMVWLLANDLDYKAATETKLEERFPYFEFSAFELDPKFKKGKMDDSITVVETLQRPRFIKTHSPLSLLPAQLLTKKPKIVCVLRDPKDVAVSYYYHYCLLFGYQGTMEKFFEAFMEGSLLYGCYWHFVAPFWELRHEPNVLVLTYGDMKKDLPTIICRMASFLGKTVTDEQVAKLADHLSLSSMRENDAVNYKSLIDVFKSVHQRETEPGLQFIRNGRTGDHKEKMSPEMITKFDMWNAKMKLELGIPNDFPY